MPQSQNVRFVKEELEVINYFMATFQNFARKLDTGWTKKAVKPILETRNINDVCVYVSLIHGRIKNLKSCSVKKNSSDFTKFKIIS